MQSIFVFSWELQWINLLVWSYITWRVLIHYSGFWLTGNDLWSQQSLINYCQLKINEFVFPRSIDKENHISNQLHIKLSKCVLCYIYGELLFFSALVCTWEPVGLEDFVFILLLWSHERRIRFEMHKQTLLGCGHNGLLKLSTVLPTSKWNSPFVYLISTLSSLLCRLKSMYFLLVSQSWWG